MSNGLFLSTKDFNALPAKSKLTCLYENQVKTFDLLDNKNKKETQIILTQRVQYGIISALIFGLVFLIKHSIGAA